jgi:acetyl-CoA carboxylase biotin carboxyl carrier protein
VDGKSLEQSALSIGVVKTVELDFNEIRELLAVLNQSDISELTLKSEDFELTVRKSVPVAYSVLAPEAAPAPETAMVAPPTVTQHQPSRPQPDTAAPAPAADANLLDITSPMVGTFYRAPAPGEASFVEIGDRIRSGQVVCILEAMKLMNELEAEVSGEVVEILVDNGEPVEYGQVLMRVKPA